MWFHELPFSASAETFSARLSAQLVPETSGEHHFSLVSAGLSRLYLDGNLLVDNWDAWQPADNYFGEGSREAIGVTQLESGKSYQVTVEYSYRTVGTLGLKAVRVGVLQPLGDEAMERAVQLAASSDVAVVCVGLNGEWDTEGRDRPHMNLVGRQDDLIARVAAANPRSVVVLQTGGPVTMPWLDRVAAVLEAWYPGQECGNALADVLFGAVNPSGRLPQTFPVSLEDNPAFGNYPGENGRVHYGEGIFVGYRQYDKSRTTPLFPFGHGLSYTAFEYANLRLQPREPGAGDAVTVSIDVTNTGARAGQEVVQVYVADPVSRLPRPAKELKGFAKVFLRPGETRAVSLTLDMRALAYYDDARPGWIAEAGEFEVLVGSSSRDIRAQTSLRLREDVLL